MPRQKPSGTFYRSLATGGEKVAFITAKKSGHMNDWPLKSNASRVDWSSVDFGKVIASLCIWQTCLSLSLLITPAFE